MCRGQAGGCPVCGCESGSCCFGCSLIAWPKLRVIVRKTARDAEEALAVLDDRAVCRSISELLQLERIGDAQRDVALIAPHLVARRRGSSTRTRSASRLPWRTARDRTRTTARRPSVENFHVAFVRADHTIACADRLPERLDASLL